MINRLVVKEEERSEGMTREGMDREGKGKKGRENDTNLQFTLPNLKPSMRPCGVSLFDDAIHRIV